MFVAMQIRCPSKIILIKKMDPGAAYRCIHANARTASTYIAITDNLALLCLHLPFRNDAHTGGVHYSERRRN